MGQRVKGFAPIALYHNIYVGPSWVHLFLCLFLLVKALYLRSSQYSKNYFQHVFYALTEKYERGLRAIGTKKLKEISRKSGLNMKLVARCTYSMHVLKFKLDLSILKYPVRNDSESQKSPKDSV